MLVMYKVGRGLWEYSVKKMRFLKIRIIIIIWLIMFITIILLFWLIVTLYTKNNYLVTTIIWLNWLTHDSNNITECKDKLNSSPTIKRVLTFSTEYANKLKILKVWLDMFLTKAVQFIMLYSTIIFNIIG